VTKTWPEDVFPLQPVGRLVLNRNPDNFFNENEQLAFCPALVVPGARALALCGSLTAAARASDVALFCTTLLRCRAVTVTRPHPLPPSNTGVSYSDDKLLQTRIFSYADTQRHR
jgi:catalase